MCKQAILALTMIAMLCCKLFAAEPCPVTTSSVVDVVQWRNTGAFYFKQGDRADCAFFLISVRGLLLNKIDAKLREEFLQKFKLPQAKIEVVYQGRGATFGQVQLEDGSDLGEVLLRGGYGLYYFSQSLNAVWQQVYSDAALKAKQEGLRGSLLDEKEYGFSPASTNIKGDPLKPGKAVHKLLYPLSDGYIIATKNRRSAVDADSINFSFYLIGIQWNAEMVNSILSAIVTAKKLETDCLKERYAVAYIDGSDLALMLLRKGQAAISSATIVLLSQVRQEVYKTAERQAKLSGIGIWQ